MRSKLPESGLGDGLDAAGAEDFEVAVISGAEADVVHLRSCTALFAAVLDEQVGLAFDRERGDLADVGGVVQRVREGWFRRSKGFIEELDRGDDHDLRVGLWWGGVKFLKCMMRDGMCSRAA